MYRLCANLCYNIYAYIYTQRYIRIYDILIVCILCICHETGNLALCVCMTWEGSYPYSDDRITKIEKERVSLVSS